MSSSVVTWTRCITERASAQAVLVQRWVFIVVVVVVGLNENISCKQAYRKVSSARALAKLGLNKVSKDYKHIFDVSKRA